VPPCCKSCGSKRVRRRYRLQPFDVYACDACTIWFRHPLPDERELTAMYEDARYHESAYFQNARPGYPRRAPEVRIYRRALADLGRLVGEGDGGHDARRALPAMGGATTAARRLLDVGCGTGVFLDLAREAGWDVAGVELSARHAAHARTTFGLDVWQGDFLAVPFAPGSFAAVTMWDFLEHVLDPRAVLAQARRLLVPGGLLLVFTIDCTSLFNTTAGLVYRASGGRAVRPIELLYDARHNYYFTPPALARLIETAGFRIERWHADRAYLGRWLAEPAPSYLVAGGFVLDLLSVAVGRPYRRTALCRRVGDG
jgi:SAM-dependent methyltransferase